jgi:NUMOD3 motif
LAFDVRIVADGLSSREAFVLEIERIAFWRSQGAKLVNITSGGAGSCCEVSQDTRRKQKTAQRKRQDEGRGTKLSSEARAKISASLTGRKRPPEERAKISATMKGRSPSPEHRMNLSASQKGRRFTPEHRARATAALQKPEVRAKLSAAAKAREAAKAANGFTISDETRAKLAAATKARWAEGRGTPMTAETRAKISATKRARKANLT